MKQEMLDFLAACERMTLAHMGNNVPAVKQRELAAKLYDIERHVHDRLIAMQGKLNGKAFGR